MFSRILLLRPAPLPPHHHCSWGRLSPIILSLYYSLSTTTTGVKHLLLIQQISAKYNDNGTTFSQYDPWGQPQMSKIYAVTKPHLALVVITYHDHSHPIKTNTCKAGKS